MSVITLEFELREAVDEAAVRRLLAAHFRVEIGRAKTADRVLVDTFDARLRAEGLRAEWHARRAARRQLTVHEPGAPARRADVADGPAIGVAALPAGPVRDRLAAVLEERALLPLARVRSRILPLAVVDGDDKTVVRLAIERPVAFRERTEVPLAPRLHVDAVRGYDRDFERTAGVLRDELGLPPAGTSLFDAAVAAAAGRPEGVSSKVRVDLQRGTRAYVAAGLVLTRLADVAEANVAGTLDDLDTEFLHDLRVSIRRARSVLRELRGVHPPAARARLRTELKWAQALTGPVRDLDVQLLEWEALTHTLPPQHRADLEPLRQLLVRRRAQELRRLQRGLCGRRFAAMLEAWRALAAAPPGPDDDPDRPRARLAIEVVAASRVDSVYRRMVRDGGAIDASSPDAALHELRKRGKELRYLLELFGGLFPREVVKPMVGALKDLQDFSDASRTAPCRRRCCGNARTSSPPSREGRMRCWPPA
jgi:CHAD domain-containing protein